MSNPRPPQVSPRNVPPLVCVIDDDASCRLAMERLLGSAGLPAMTFARGEDYLAREPHDGPTCVVLDLRFPQGDGWQILESLSARGEPVVFLTGHGDVPTCARAMKAGAVDFLLKPVEPEAFLTVIRQALRHSTRRIRHRSVEREARGRIALLTAREKEVFARVVDGLLNKQIAADLGIAEKTIKIHRARVMKKTGCRSVPELVRLAALLANQRT